jgi:very-short-patch-repair endonuclease
LGDEGRDPQAVAQFLMRCIFTMFAEDVGLLKEQLFTDTLRDRWLQDPQSFKPGAEALWRAMNEGNDFGFYGKLLRFNGGLFANSTAFDLTGAQLEILLKAAQRDWRNVEPAIFGTLLERALESKERSKLGAHYTPRSYVERLVRPVVLEPLRDRWEIVQAEVSLILDGNEKLTERQMTIRFNNAKTLLEGFLTELRSVKVLDPACGSGNFLYVTLDLIKQLESEVLRRLADVADVFGREQLRLEIEQVNPSQFLGIELNPRAAAIADLVIWIGYLQWHFRRFGDIPPIEPVLREYQNIECRDAVLAWDRVEPDVDKDGKVRTRWGGRVMKSAVTGEDVPDATDQVTILKYINPRQAVWPEADYIVSNPPFIGKINMRKSLGDGYAESLRRVYGDLPDAIDLVMYWWDKAANLLRRHKINSFGFISTNSLRQTYNRRVIDLHLSAKKNPLNISFAIPDHPWVNSSDGAAIRIAMTAAKLDGKGVLAEVISEAESQDDSIDVSFSNTTGVITSSLSVGNDINDSSCLTANLGLACVGYQLTGQGFVVDSATANQLEADLKDSKAVIRSLLSGRDITQNPRDLFAIDLFGWKLENVQLKKPEIFQWVLERVKPEREQNNNPTLRERWWLFEKGRATFRPAVDKLNTMVVTSLTAKHRFFICVPSQTVCDSTTVMFAFEDTYFIGILSSKTHVTWALAAGGTLEDRPRYNKTVCFDPFPFPDSTEPQKQKIRDLGDRLDAHRKRVQAAHPEVTITAMYNLLEKLRKAESLDDKDKAFNQKALVSTLKQIHNELDAAVFEAYGWEDLIGGARGLWPSPQPSPEGRGSMKNPATPTPVPAPLLPREKGLGDEGQSLPNNDQSSLTGKERRIPDPLLQRARELRQTQTPAEKILWECLRDRRLYEAKFRRQHNIGQFIADFYCHTAKLLIELDGSIHDTQIERDHDRDEWMQASGLTVLRFNNEQIFDELEAVLMTIAPHLSPSPQTSSQGTPVPLLPREKGLGDEGQPQSVDEQILDRLVKLNADRAAEERNGHIRWLRPEYQAPDQVQETQTTIAGLTPTDIPIPTPATQQKWPKDFKDQLAAIRDLLRTQGGEWSVDTIAAQFKNATRSKPTIQTCLEALETLGLVAQHTENGQVTWYFAELQKTG